VVKASGAKVDDRIAAHASAMGRMDFSRWAQASNFRIARDGRNLPTSVIPAKDGRNLPTSVIPAKAGIHFVTVKNNGFPLARE
jgi:hypothetical protein